VRLATGCDEVPVANPAVDLSTPARALFDHLLDQAIILEADGDRLRWEGPAGVVTDEIKQRLRQHKSELLPIVAEWWRTECGLGRCRQCRRIVTVNHLCPVGGAAQYECQDRADCREFVETLNGFSPIGETLTTAETAAPTPTVVGPAGQGQLGDW
jgi:hypothetical protein